MTSFAFAEYEGLKGEPMDSAIGKDDVLRALGLVTRICEDVGPGVPGSPQERRRADIFRTELESHLGSENVAVEEFEFAPGGFLGSLRIGSGLILAAALLNMLAGRASGPFRGLAAGGALLMSGAAVALILLEFFISREVLDRFLSKTTSVNVIGSLRRPGSDVRRLLILGGHHDSAPENTWFRHLGYGSMFLQAASGLGLVAAVVMNAIQIAGVLAGRPDLVRAGTLGWAGLVFLIAPPVVFGLFFTRIEQSGGTVPGAADNLSGSALITTIGRVLARNPSIIPSGTEVRLISFGAEEAGLRGSRRYVARHLEELKKLDARLLNLETVAYPEITILTSDVGGSVLNSAEMVRSVVGAAERAGVPYRLKPAMPGIANDSGTFSRAGLKALTLLPFRIPRQMIEFYHQRWDRPDVLTEEPFLNVLKLALEWVRRGGE